MTSSETANTTSGEERMKKRRNSFLRYLTLTFLLAMMTGFASGAILSNYEDGSLPIWVPLLAGAITIAGLTWFTWDFFQRIDEVDLMDNLWAHLIGFYVAMILFLGWYFLAEMQLLQYPSAIAVVIMMIGAMTLAYGVRKLRLF